MANTWGYSRENGPKKWKLWFPVAVEGHRQSPVDIESIACETTACKKWKKLSASFSPTALLRLEHTGRSWQVTFDPIASSLTGGPLISEFKVTQMHAHWGGEEGRGSEHSLEGQRFDGELHIVHYNTKYRRPEYAIDKPDGLAVLAVFLQVGRKPHMELDKVFKALDRIQEGEGQTTEILSSFDPQLCLPDERSYFTYPGSLTTPPLMESVTWIVFRSPVEISAEQMQSMRSLQSPDGSKSRLVDNFRPAMTRGSRIIHYCDEC